MGFKAIISKLRDRFKSSAVQGDGGKMKAQLYFTPTSCGAASYIAATKAGLIGTKVDANLADIMTKKIKSGAKKGGDFKEVNPKGNVPALVLPDGTLLNENAAVLQWIADQNPDAGLSPASGNARYLLQAKISYIASEVHANAGPLFGQLEPAAKEAFVAALKKRLDYLSNNDLAGGKKYLVGDTFTIADSYLYICLSWLGYLGLNLGDWPVLKAYSDGIAELDFVKAAHEAMSKLDAANK